MVATEPRATGKRALLEEGVRKAGMEPMAGQGGILLMADTSGLKVRARGTSLWTSTSEESTRCPKMSAASNSVRCSRNGLNPSRNAGIR